MLKKISVIGGGSWPTALIKIFAENQVEVNWYLRREEQAVHINEHGINPDYLNFAPLSKQYIKASTDLPSVIEKSDIVLFAAPSSYLPAIVAGMDKDSLRNKKTIVSIKGLVTEENLLPTSFLSTYFNLSQGDQVVIGGPCHAEEIAMNKKTYITLATTNETLAHQLREFFASPYIQVNLNSDPVGIEYAAIYKNIVGLMCGIAKGLNYGDNFIAVLVANAIHELSSLLNKLYSTTDTANSSYLGDLLVTAYSQHSRNRTFGQLIGRGYNITNIKEVTHMVAEGYPATKGMYQTAQALNISMPIVHTAYRILYKHMPVGIEFKLLERSIK